MLIDDKTVRRFAELVLEPVAEKYAAHTRVPSIT
jgi:hypothetical protein